MSQKHYAQYGTFHVITNAKKRVPWLTLEGVPEVLIDNLVMTRNVYGGKLFAFSIQPNHMHILMSPGEKGLSQFMCSFKSNSSRDIRLLLGDKSHNARSWGPRAPAPGMVDRICDFTGWHNGFYDERIQSSEQRSSAFHYIRSNAVKHHLVDETDEWPWTSLHFPHLLDEMELWD